MSSSYDIERICPEETYDDFGPDKLLELNRRIVKLETILTQHVTQWTAPTLIRGQEDNLYVQAGKVIVPHTAIFYGWIILYNVYFPKAFDEIPIVTATISTCGFTPAAPRDVWVVDEGKTGFTLVLLVDQDPTSGECHVAWQAIGKKAL